MASCGSLIATSEYLLCVVAFQMRAGSPVLGSCCLRTAIAWYIAPSLSHTATETQKGTAMLMPDLKQASRFPDGRPRSANVAALRPAGLHSRAARHAAPVKQIVSVRFVRRLTRKEVTTTCYHNSEFALEPKHSPNRKLCTRSLATACWYCEGEIPN